MEPEDNLIAIDPGLRVMGAAYFYDGTLARVGLIEGESDTKIRDVRASQAMAESFRAWLGRRRDEYKGAVAYERMKHYTGRGKAAPDDLFQLVGVTHACIAPFIHASEITGYLPGRWTSKRAKRANHGRIKRRLSGDEFRRLEDSFDDIPSGQQEHVLDAVGIGLYHLKRL